MKKEQKVSWWFAGAVCALVLMLWIMGAWDGMENMALDARFKMRGPAAHADTIAIVSIDDASIERLGRWPWRRDVHGRLVSVLKKAGARAVLFDVLFTEADKEHPAADRRFGAENVRAGTVVLDSFFSGVTGEGMPTGLTLPVASIGTGVATGFANFYPEMDGLTRKARLVVQTENALVPSLAVQGIARALGSTPENVLADTRIAMDQYQEILINFAGGYQTFPYYSFHKVLDGSVPVSAFKDKIVLVGGTATALFDVTPVTFGHVFPGVEIHANVVSNILRGDYLRPVSGWMTLFLIILFTLLPAVIIGRFSPLAAGMWSGGVCLLFIVVCQLVFTHAHIVLACVAPLIGFLMSFIGILLYRFMTVEKEKRWIKKTFSQYLSARVMENILANPAALHLGGRREMMTVLFSDIRNFTTISEALSPEEVVDLLNEYLSVMVDVVFRHDGTLDKFIGDAVMVFWGAPAPDNNHARKAVLCALDMMDELQKLQERWKAEGRPLVDIGIGINTGDMVVGNMGSREKMEYTVIGDNVNLASRLEGLNKEYKTHIIISSSTFVQVRNVVETRPLGSVKVKGKEQAHAIFEVLGRKA